MTDPLMRRRRLAVAALLLTCFVPADHALACACGCGVFAVGANTVLPTATGLSIYVEADLLDQGRNWSNSRKASADDNADKQIDTQFYTLGLQYKFNPSWGVIAQIPYWQRRFRTDVNFDAGGPQDVESFDHGALGDVRLQGSYSGLFEDGRTGITLGLKLPTGDDRYANFDPDTEIGTGSTDTLIGAWHTGALTEDLPLSWFGQVLWQRAFLHRDDYRPGNEFDASLGVSYSGIALGEAALLTPTVRLAVSRRERDTGAGADYDNSGSTRLLMGFGLGLDIGETKLYTELAVPLVQHVNGNQLVASHLVKFLVSYAF